ncbi:hypothetical protein [Desulfatiglans anilini]|uniref:hypothetical protein n=1 Tax=Desulfatiglans anilini TaxID=90728 RepID=UPI0003FEAF81|nr:hypothetical protein [Desulfatiglans anilini]
MESSRSDAGCGSPGKSAAAKRAMEDCAEHMDELVGLISWLQIDQIRKRAFKHEKPLARLADRWFVLCKTFEDRTRNLLDNDTEEDPGKQRTPSLLSQIERTEATLQELSTERAIVTQQHLEVLDNLLETMEAALGIPGNQPQGPLTDF